MFKKFSQFQIFKKKNLTLFSYFEVSQQCPYLYIFTCYCPMEGKKRRFMAMSALRPIFYLGGLSVLRREKKSDGFPFICFHTWSPVWCRLRIWRIGRREHWDWSDEEKLPSGPCCARRGSACAGRPAEWRFALFYEAIFNRTVMLCCTKVVSFVLFFKRRVFRLLKIFSDVSKLCLN